MRPRRRVPILATAVAAAGLLACQPAEEGGADADGAGDASAASTAAPGVVEVIARDYAFEAPDAIPSGWTTLRFENRGQEPHFVLFDRLPEDVTFREYMGEAGAAFDTVWRRLRDGEIDRAGAGQTLGRLLPGWYASVAQTGGTGLVMPGETARTTLRLEPGSYVIECYVKTPDGEFHTSRGMARPVTVTGDSTGAEPPEADLELAVTTDEISVTGTPSSGRHTVAVHFEEQPEAGLGNDVHLVRLEGDAAAADVAPWMDWMNLDGLRSPAPAEFLGGTQEMPAGETAYFTVELEPGRYAWISEAPIPRSLFTEFSVE